MAPSRSPAELAALNTISSELAEHIKARPVNLPEWSTDVMETREARAKHLESLRHLLPIPAAIPDIVEEKDVSVTAWDGYQIRVRVYAPKNPDRKAYPVIVLIHEGGFIFGDLTDEQMNARMFVRDTGAVCLNVEYRLAPENQFPAGIKDCFTALAEAATKPEKFHKLADPKLGLVVGGSSAGGNISAVLAQVARAEGLNPPVTGQWLSCPYLVVPGWVPEKYKEEWLSPFENKDDPVLGPLPPEKSAGLLRIIGVEDYDDPWLQPFASSLYPPSRNSHDGKPPLAKAFISVAGMDPLRDDGLIYEQALREEWHVETRLDLYPGYSHMFFMNWPEMEESLKWWKNMVDGMRWLLQS